MKKYFFVILTSVALLAGGCKKNFEPKSVSDTVISVFLAKLSKIESFAEVAENLHKTVIEDRTYTEFAIRSAIFPESP